MSLLYQVPHGQPSSDRHPCAPLLHVTLKDLGGLGKKAAIQQSKAIMAAVVAKLPRQVQAAAVDLDGMSEDNEYAGTEVSWAGRNVSFTATLEAVASQQLVRDVNLNSDADVTAKTSRNPLP